MRPWLLLLLSLLVSDLTPPGDGDWVMDYFSWTLCRKLILSGKMIPKGLKILLTQTDYRCMCFKRDYVYADLLHKQMSYFFYWQYRFHSGNGLVFSFQDLPRIMQRSPIPALAVLLCDGEGKLVPALLLISYTPPTKASGKSSHIALDIIKDSPDYRPARLVHHHSFASRQNLQALLLEKSKIWAPAVTAQLQKMLTNLFCITRTRTASCCPKHGEKLSEMNIRKTLKEEFEPPKIKQKGSTQRVMDIKALFRYRGKGSLGASVSQHDFFRAASLHSGTSSVKTSDMSHLEAQRHAAILMKKDHLNLNEDSTWQKSFQKQLSLKAASGADDGGFDVTRQLLLVSRENKGSRNRPQNKIRPAQDDNNELFSGKMITNRAELRHPEGEHKAEQSTNTMENGNQKRFAYVLQRHSTHKTDIHDVNEKQMLSDVREEGLIMLFLPDAQMETQTEPAYERKPIPNTGIRLKANIPELGDLPPITKALKDITTEQYDLKCKCVQGSQCLLEIYTIYSTEGMDIKAAERKETTEEKVKETTEKTEPLQTNNTHNEIIGINNTKHEEHLKTEESVIPSPPSLKMMTTEHIADATPANMKIKDTTISMEVISRSSPEKDDGQPNTEERPTTRMSPEPEADTEAGFKMNSTATAQAVTEKPFSGLRMREDVLANIAKLHKGTESEEGVLISRTESERLEDQNDPGVKSFTFSTHLEAVHKEPTERPPKELIIAKNLRKRNLKRNNMRNKPFKTSGDTVPLCGGLIHRTEAGWKHCKERLRGTKSKLLSSRDPMGTAELEKDSIRRDSNSLPDNDENDHFYYFDGVLKRVQNNFYTYYKRWRSNAVPTQRHKRGTHENFLSYIRRLILRNKVTDFKRLGAEDDVQRPDQ